MDLLQTDGYGQVTMEGIAKRARVSKQTIYRWWPSTPAVLMEALNERASALVTDRDLGSLERNLRHFIRRTVAALHDGLAPLLAGLMAAAQSDPEFAVIFNDQFLERRRAALRELFDQALRRGEIVPGTDVDLLVEIAFGTVWYRVLGHHQPLRRRFADQLTDALLALTTGQTTV
jgi:AcrR family transcriptional regulator